MGMLNCICVCTGLLSQRAQCQREADNGGGAIDEHLLFIFAMWSGLTGNKCVQEVNKAGECVKKSVSQVYVAVRRCCPELNSRGE